jgi:hypothetical protein
MTPGRLPTLIRSGRTSHHQLGRRHYQPFLHLRYRLLHHLLRRLLHLLHRLGHIPCRLPQTSYRPAGLIGMFSLKTKYFS